MVIRAFVIGLLVGAALFACLTVFSQEKPVIKGESGRLEGIEVLDRDGRLVCTDPWYHSEQKIVGCD